jgi:hypothetical protein
LRKAEHDRQQAEAQRQQAQQLQQAREAERVRIAQLAWAQQASTEERAWIDHLQKWDTWLKQTPEATWNHTERRLRL